MALYNKQVTSYIDGLGSPQKEICEQSRTLIEAKFPQLEEKWGWSRPLYATGGKHVRYLVANKNDVNLGFEQGARLDDPRGLLVGTGINMRHVKIRALEDLDIDYFEKLLAEAIETA